MSDGDQPRGPAAIDSFPWKEWSGGVRFATRYRVLSDTRGADRRKIGITFEELPPGKQSVPFHYHLVEEEHLVALDGQATLRLGDARHPIKAGDYVAFPAGQKAGHCLINESDRPFRYLMVGDHSPHEVCVYPDSQKVLIRAHDAAMVRETERVPYLTDERADEPAT